MVRGTDRSPPGDETAHFQIMCSRSKGVQIMLGRNRGRVMLLWCTSFQAANSHGFKKYRKTSNKSRTLVGNIIVDNSDVVGASPVGAAPTTSSFST